MITPKRLDARQRRYLDKIIKHAEDLPWLKRVIEPSVTFISGDLEFISIGDLIAGILALEEETKEKGNDS